MKTHISSFVISYLYNIVARDSFLVAMEVIFITNLDILLYKYCDLLISDIPVLKGDANNLYKLFI